MDYLKFYGSNQNETDSLERTVERIEQLNGEEIVQIGEEGYKYLGILEKEDKSQEEIKKKIRKERGIRG